MTKKTPKNIAINISDFSRFFTLIQFVKGDSENKHVLLNCSPAGLKALTVDKDKNLAIKGELKGAFNDLGDLGVPDLTLLKTFFSKVQTESISFKRTENKLVIEANGVRFSSPLTNPKYIENVLKEDKFDSRVKTIGGATFTLRKEDINNLVALYETLKPSVIFVTGKNNKIIFDLLADEKSISASYDIETTVDFKIKVVPLLTDILSQVKDFEHIQFETKTNSPILIRIKNENLTFTYLLSTCTI